MRTWRLPADIDTDQLAPGHAMKHGLDVIAKHCLEAVRPEFARQVRPGDVIVAGENFGIDRLIEGERGFAQAQRAGFVENDGIDLGQAFQSIGGLDENAMSEQATDGGHLNRGDG